MPLEWDEDLVDYVKEIAKSKGIRSPVLAFDVDVKRIFGCCGATFLRYLKGSIIDRDNVGNDLVELDVGGIPVYCSSEAIEIVEKKRVVLKKRLAFLELEGDVNGIPI
ncbi:MAG: hypothetical protein ACXQTI_06000 [Candidatus Nezhaarchaeales archaeon]